MLLKTARVIMGLDEYEEFFVTQCNVTRTFRFTMNALEWWNGEKWVEDRDALYEILNKECEVKYQEFIPVKGETYFTYSTFTPTFSPSVEHTVMKTTWEDSFDDFLRLKQGIVFYNYNQAAFKEKEVLECIMRK